MTYRRIFRTPVFRSTGVSFLVVAVFFLLNILREKNDLVHNDVGWYLYGAERLIHGATLYRDVVDLNPPLIYFINLPPVWLATFLGVPATAVYKGFIFLLICVALILCQLILRRLNHAWHEEAKSFTFIMIAFLLILLAAGNFGYKGTSFGQREHIMMILVIPYLLASIARAEGIESSNAIKVLIGLFAGIGIAIKPHFVLVWLMTEGYLFAVCRNRHTWKSPESIIILSILISYWLVVGVFFPDYIAFGLKAAQVYGAYDTTFYELLTQQTTILWLIAIVILLATRSDRNGRHAPELFFVAGTSLLIAALFQRKGWGYQYYPSRVALLLSLGFLFTFRLQHLKWFSKLRLMTVAILLMIFVAVKVTVESFVRPLPGSILSLSHFVQEDAKGKSVMFLSTVSEPQFPFVNYAHVGWTSRFTCLWFLPHFYGGVSVQPDKPFPYHKPHEMSLLEKGFFDEVIFDIVVGRPDLLFNDIGDVKYPFGQTRFNFLEYYSMDSRFASLLHEYRLVGSIDRFAVYKRGISDPRSPIIQR